MALPGGYIYDPDRDFRLIHDEVNDVYYIQKKRFFIGWKFLNFKFKTRKDANHKLYWLRREYRKQRTKKHYVVLDD